MHCRRGDSHKPPQIRNRKFSPFEDKRIIEFVSDCGGSCTQVQWLLLDEELARDNLSAKLRWTNVLKPRLRMALVDRVPKSDGSAEDLAAAVQYKRQPYSASEDARILQFAIVRNAQVPHIPWCRIDHELGRAAGACKHRYETLQTRKAKEEEKNKRQAADVQCATPRRDQIGRVRKSHRLSYHDDVTSSPAATDRTAPELENLRVKYFTPEEDELIANTLLATRGREMTNKRWKALAAQLKRPVSWLRYRCAVLARRQEEAKVLDDVVVSTRHLAPTPGSVEAEMLHIIDTIIEAICETPRRCGTGLTRQVVVTSLPTPLLHVSDKNACRVFSAAEATRIKLQMIKCSVVSDDVWASVSEWLPTHDLTTIKRCWPDRQKFVALIGRDKEKQVIRVLSAIDGQLAYQRECAWHDLARDMFVSVHEVHCIWSRLWFSVHFPGLLLIKSNPISPAFSAIEDEVIKLRMSVGSAETSLSCWLPDLALFLSKPVHCVAAQWKSLSSAHVECGSTYCATIHNTGQSTASVSTKISALEYCYQSKMAF